jgi:hypothetical protein
MSKRTNTCGCNSRGMSLDNRCTPHVSKNNNTFQRDFSGRVLDMFDIVLYREHTLECMKCKTLFLINLLQLAVPLLFLCPLLSFTRHALQAHS